MSCIRSDFLNHLSSLFSITNNIPANLTITEPVVDQVRGTAKRYLKLCGNRVLVHVPEFFRETGLKFMMKNNMTSVLVPLDDSTKASLQAIENFVQENVEGTYKPLWLKEAMYVNVSKWCEYMQVNDDNTQSPIQPGTFLGKGFYTMIINPSGVYIGPHKNGETHSLNLHVTRITYRPAQDIMDLIANINADFDKPMPDAAPTETKLNKPPKKKGGRGKKSELSKSAASTSKANVL